MVVRNIIYNLLVVFALLSYSFTIPLLSSIHSHNIRVSRHTSNSIELHDNSSSSKEDPLTCEVCFRITSAQVVVNADSQFHATLPVESGSVLQNVKAYFSTTHLLLQDRAPPLA